MLWFCPHNLLSSPRQWFRLIITGPNGPLVCLVVWHQLLLLLLLILGGKFLACTQAIICVQHRQILGNSYIIAVLFPDFSFKMK